jgi:hypothetical protein
MSQTFAYDIHDIITVVSDTILPELEPFRVDFSIPQPTIHRRRYPLHALPRAFWYVGV